MLKENSNGEKCFLIEEFTLGLSFRAPTRNLPVEDLSPKLRDPVSQHGMNDCEGNLSSSNFLNGNF